MALEADVSQMRSLNAQKRVGPDDIRLRYSFCGEYLADSKGLQ